MEHQHRGLEEAQRYPLFSAIAHRRSRRISKGLRTVAAGSLTYASTKEPQPLSPLEEALLIAATGTTGTTMPDRPFHALTFRGAFRITSTRTGFFRICRARPFCCQSSIPRASTSTG